MGCSALRGDGDCVVQDCPLTIKGDGNGVHGGRDAHRSLDLFGAEPRLAQLMFVRFQAEAAAVYADTASDHSSKSAFSTPGLAMAFMRSLAGSVL